MKFFITGAAGFIGSNLADKLLEFGHDVVAFDNFDTFYPENIKRQNISKAKKNNHYYLIEGNILDKQKLYNTIIQTRPDIVIHLAAKAGVRPSIDNPDVYYDVNVKGTLNLLECMRQADVTKMIFASSSSIYGNNLKTPFSETDKVDKPISPYAASKKAGELLCYTYHHLYNFDIFCLRFFTVFGPRQRPDLAINKFFKAIENDLPITMYGDGSSKRDYTYIDDIVNGIIKSIEKLNGYEIINLGNSFPVSLLDLIQGIEGVVGKKALINYSDMQQGDVNITYADTRKATKVIDYMPEIDVKKGLGLYYNWLRKH